MNGRKQLWQTLIPLGLILLPGLIVFIYIFQFAVNIPFWDQWEFIPTLRLFRQGNPNWLQAAWHPHVSHRLFLPKLIFLGLAQLTNWNILAEIYLSYLLTWVYLFALWLIYRRVSVGSLWGVVPIAWLIFSLGQWENMLWGWQVAVYLLMVGLAFSIYFLSLKRLVWVIAAALLALVASLSFINGLLVWPIGLLLLLLLKAEKKAIAFWGVVSILVITLYFWNFTIPQGPTSPTDALAIPLTTLQYFLANVGAGIGGANVTVLLATGAGVFLLGSVLFILWHKIFKNRSRPFFSASDAILGALLLFSLASSAFITVGRVGLGVMEWSLSSRYITITSIGIISIYLFLLNLTTGDRRQPIQRVWFAIFLFLVGGGQIMHMQWGFRMGTIQYESRLKAQYALRTTSQQADEVLARVYVPEVIRQRTPYLRQQNLSLFAVPEDSLYLTSLVRQGKPYGKILPERPFVQQFTCPVEDLHNFSILFTTYGRENQSDIRITLQENEQIIWQQKVSTATISDNEFRYFSLDQPLRECKGRELTLRITSLNGSAADAITVWTYPAYYEGRILDASTFTERTVGLELNAFHSN